MQIVSIGDNLYDMSEPVFWKKIRKYFDIMSSAENVTQSAKHLRKLVLCITMLLKSFVASEVLKAGHAG